MQFSAQAEGFIFQCISGELENFKGASVYNENQGDERKGNERINAKRTNTEADLGKEPSSPSMLPNKGRKGGIGGRGCKIKSFRMRCACRCCLFLF